MRKRNKTKPKWKKLNRRNGRKRFGYVVSGDVAADAIFLFIDSWVLVVLVVVVRDGEREKSSAAKSNGSYPLERPARRTWQEKEGNEQTAHPRQTPLRKMKFFFDESETKDERRLKRDGVVTTRDVAINRSCPSCSFFLLKKKGKDKYQVFYLSLE